MNLAEHFLYDKETFLELYLDAISSHEKLKYDFDKDDVLNGFGVGSFDGVGLL